MLFWDFQKPKFKKNLQIFMYGSSTLAKNYRRMFKFVYLAFSQIWLNIYSFGSLPLWLRHIIDKEKEKEDTELGPELQLNNLRFFINVKELPNTDFW